MRFSTTTLTLFLTALASLSTTQARIGQTHSADHRMMMEEATAAGNFKCYNGGCNGHGLVQNCSKCVDDASCAYWGHGVWADCSDDNRMLEEEDAGNDRKLEDATTEEETAAGNFKCYNGGCNGHGLVQNCSKCVDDASCAYWGHGVWADCSDDNRMLEEEDAGNDRKLEDATTEEETAAGNFKCYNGGCNGHGLVQNCSKCVDDASCAYWGHGVWADCSDDNRMLEEEDSGNDRKLEDATTEEETAAGNFKCYNGGCNGHGLVQNCSKCVDDASCAYWGHGVWADCSDDNRMLEEEDSGNDRKLEDATTEEETAAGNFKCYNGGCNGHGLVQNCSKCVDDASCAYWGHGVWADCSDDNRMLEEEDSGNDRKLEDATTEEETAAGNFKCYNGGCNGHGLVQNCSKCVDDASCAYWGHGVWADCSDDKRMLEGATADQSI